MAFEAAAGGQHGAGERRVGGVDEQGHFSSAAAVVAAAEVGRDDDGDPDVPLVQQPAALLLRDGVGDDVEGLGGLELADQVARGVGAGEIDDDGLGVPDVLVDGVAEESQLDDRHPDDESQRQLVAHQLAQLLARHRERPAQGQRQSPREPHDAALAADASRPQATKTSSRLGSASVAVGPLDDRLRAGAARSRAPPRRPRARLRPAARERGCRAG